MMLDVLAARKVFASGCFDGGIRVWSATTMRKLFCSVSNSGPVRALSFLPLAASPSAALDTSSRGNDSVPARYRYGYLVGGGPSGLQMCTIEASCDASGLPKLELESSCTDMLHSGSDVCLDLAIVRRPIAEGLDMLAQQPWKRACCCCCNRGAQTIQ